MAEILANERRSKRTFGVGKYPLYHKYIDGLVANYESNKAQHGVPEDSLGDLGAQDWLVQSTDKALAMIMARR